MHDAGIAKHLDDHRGHVRLVVDDEDCARGGSGRWLANSSHGHVAFWDFDDPASFNATRDTSASAIVAAALLKLAVVAAAPRRAVYQREAEAIVTALVERFLDQRGVLSHGCDDKPHKVATKHELIWGSYDLLEAVECWRDACHRM